MNKRFFVTMHSQVRVALEVQRRRYLLLIYIGLFLILIGVLISLISYHSFYYSFLPVFIISGIIAIVVGMRQRRYMLTILEHAEFQPPLDDEQLVVGMSELPLIYSTEEYNGTLSTEQFKEAWILALDKNMLPPLPG